MKYALITGASKGIGKAMAFELASKGYNVLLVARSEELLEKVSESICKEYKVQAPYLAIDLLDGNVSQGIYNYCVEHKYFINILINNAGFGQFGRFADNDKRELFRMMRLNQELPIELCHIFMPMLQSMGRAHILNVSSIAALVPIPNLSSFAASKAFIYSFSRALRYEMRKTKVSISCLCPGLTKSDFFDRSGLDAVSITESSSFVMDAEDVAKKAIKGMLNNKDVIIPGTTNWIASCVAKVIPKRLLIRLTGKIFSYQS